MWNTWTENLKKRICKYLIQRYLGQYLQEKLTLDQLTVDLYNGTGTITNISLDCGALNTLAEQQAIPIQFIDGHLESISLSIPWSNLLQDSCEIEISGLRITLQPKKRIENGSTMLESMWTSMASSMQLAEECLKTSDFEDEKEYPPDESSISGLEHCAQAIDAVFSRCKICFKDTFVRVERVQRDCSVGVAFECHIKTWKYSDEVCDEQNDEAKKSDSAFSEKKIELGGISCYTDIYQDFESTYYQEGHEELENQDVGSGDNKVLIAKFGGTHEIKVRIKEDESIRGPQISVDARFGSLIAFLSPMQAHILSLLIEELLNPEPTPSMEDLSFRPLKEKPMDKFDFKRVEQELQEHIKPTGIGMPGLQRQGWSSSCMDDSDEEFLPLRSKSGLFSSVHSTLYNTSMMTSASSSLNQGLDESIYSAGNYQPSSKPSQPYHSGSPNKKTLYGGCSQIDTEKAEVSMSFTSAAVVLLHEDILILSSSHSNPVEYSTVQKLRGYSTTFFETLGIFSAASGKRHLEPMREKLDKSCLLNHLRLICAPIKLQLDMSVNDGVPVTSGRLSAGYAELRECLREKSNHLPDPVGNIELLSFGDDAEQSESIRVDFKHKIYQSRSPVTKTTLRVRLEKCTSELDISIVDRLNSLLNSSLYYYATNDKHKLKSQLCSRPQSVIMLKVNSPSLSVNFRFPIPDLREPSDLGRMAYWMRNIRNDSFILQMKSFEFSTTLNSTVDVLELDTKCQEAQLFYKENPTEQPVLFAEAASYDDEVDGNSMRSQGFDWPRAVVWISPKKTDEPLPVLQTTVDDECEPLSFPAFARPTSNGPSPFSSRRVVHECLNSDGLKDENESVIPGDKTEINDFIDSTSKDVMYKVELNLRSVSVSLPSKHFFEELYNRLSTDLLLWMPSAPKHLKSISKARIFHEFKENTAPSGSGSEDEEEISAFYTPNQAHNFSLKCENPCVGLGQNEVTFNLVIKKGICSFYTPFTNTNGSVVPEQKGQVTFKIDQGQFFVVSGFGGNPNLGFMSFGAQKAELYHIDMVRNGSDIPRFGNHLKRTIYSSEDGMLLTSRSDTGTNGNEYTEMLSVAIRIDRDPIKHVKTFKVAVGIKDGTLDHSVSPANRSWFTQLLDFFDVTDTPISGYIPSAVVTELHLHLWNCAINYAPLNLPLRSVLTTQNFSLSSNIVAQTNTSVIRIMAEDAAFYLTTKLSSSDIKGDYVCVVDMDLFELTLRLCHSRSSIAPRVELNASNNILNIRTCSDSFKALMDIITYYANYGDIDDPQKFNQRDDASTPTRESPSEPALIDTQDYGDKEKRMSQSQTEHVHELVAEAMQDNDFTGIIENGNCKEIPNSKTKSRNTFELHFEDNSALEIESGVIPVPNSYKYYEPIMQSSSDLPIEINPSDDDDEEFCILENDPGVGILPKSGEPEARLLTDEPIRLIENHFSAPVGRSDILKAPKHYPNPVMRYTLQEMSLILHLYGGEDFESVEKSSNRSNENEPSETESGKFDIPRYYEDEIDIGIDALNSSVFFSKTKAFETATEAYESSGRQRKNVNHSGKYWRNQGGRSRKQDVCVELHMSKMKFQHEVYPENAEQASRQVLILNALEVWDRLASSQFNKMLYLYTSTAKPKQSHANMVVIKAAHLRPDPQLNIEECCLKISILPIRLNIDQDALLFLYHFFVNVSVKLEPDGDDDAVKPPSHTPSIESLPVMMVNNIYEEASNGEDDDPENLLLFDDSPVIDDDVSTCSKDPSIDSNKSNLPVYFRQVIFTPEVPIRIDYMGKRLDLTHGPLAGILMGLGQLNCSEIKLKRVIHRHGILGFEKLITLLLTEWTSDIKKNQLPSLLGGIGPMYSFVQLFQGVRDLFWLPIEQYQKDGRIAKGLQRGANAFSASAAMAALELTNRLVQTIQGAAEFTYDMVSPGPSMQQQRRLSTRKKRLAQPSDIREGVANAYHVVKEGVSDTAKTIVRVASKEHEQKGFSGAVGGVLRQIAPTVCVPIILSSQATSSVLDGFISQLEPESKKEAAEKWKES